MKKDPRIYLEHILSSIQRINSYSQGFSESDFLNSPLIQDAVIRNLEVIGEATKKLSSEFRENYPQNEWKKIAGMRDKLIHDYIGVDLWAVWAVVEQILPDFEIQIESIIKE
ncbi:HepT-like ribonuclease domain-containing protein [Algoriphagus mannitolivorans]|uniref:HepT-like ribonuclease domain-containing protein n=1 Tax=Algoriphagus mannitolivorans TaxID=226504 RepID=UPI0004019155|nr:DUF86 domain-containing protein [Algoriphagus mannitolivorans]